MNYSSAQAAAAATVAIVAAAVSQGLFGESIFAQWIQSLWARASLGVLDERVIRVIWFVVSSLGYYGLFHLVITAILRFRYRRLLGDWVYASWRWGREESLSYATLRFWISASGLLQYRVYTYASEDELRNALRRAGVPVGEARSLACDFNDELQKVSLIYEFKMASSQPGLASRVGMLQILADQQHRLVADWESSVDGKLNRGRWVAVRRRRIANLTQVALAHLAAMQQGQAAHNPQS